MSRPAPDVSGRLDRLRPRVQEAGADALVVTALANVRYLSGFSGSAALLVVLEERALLATDGRYRTQASEQLAAAGTAARIELVVGGAPEQRRAALEALAGCGRVGLEAASVSWAAQRRWARDLAGELVATTGLVEGLREVKDAGELVLMGRAAAVADQALADVLDLLVPGTAERDFALALDVAMRRLGAEDRAFETIVASGPNSAKPHARPGPRTLEAGDPVVVDFGATVEGYRSDMTRTFVVGGVPSPEVAGMVEVVLGAQAAGVAAVTPGVVAGAVDEACRTHIAEAGLADAFEHSTGHGVGLDIHEAPAVAPGSTAILRPGVVLTVEPGVYVPGVGGVRIEDTVVVTEHGCRPLTCFPKDPLAKDAAA